MKSSRRPLKRSVAIVVGCVLACFVKSSAYSPTNIRLSLAGRARMSEVADAIGSAATPRKRNAPRRISPRSRVVTRISEKQMEEDSVSGAPGTTTALSSRLKAARHGFISQVAASLCMSICVLAIAVVSPFVIDGEGWVASKFPTSLASFLRDNPAAWRTFNVWTWALTAPLLAITRPQLLLFALWRGPHEAFDLSYANGIDGGGQGCELDVYHHSLDTSSRESQGRNNDASASAADDSKDKRSTPGLRPTIVFVHGGAWSHGSRQLFALLARRLRDQLDCVVVVPGYRMWPRGDMHAQAQDVGAALRWVHAHIDKWGGDQRQIILVGHSSGAHVCATHLLTCSLSSRQTSDSNSSGDNVAHSDVSAFVGLCGVYDINAHYEHEKRRGVHEISAMKPAAGRRSDLVKPLDIQEVAGGERPLEKTGDLPPEVMTAFAAASPTLLATTATGPATLKDRGRHFPRTYLYHSADDTTVPLRSTLDFSEALREGWPHADVDLKVLDAQQARDKYNTALSGTSQPERGETRDGMLLSGGHGGVLLDLMLGDHPAPLLLAMLRRALAELQIRGD